MMGKFLPVVFLGLGLGAGIGAGAVLGTSGPGATEADDTRDAPADAPDVSASESGKAAKNNEKSDREYLKLTKQFVIPVVEHDRIAALVTMSLSLAAEPGISEAFYEKEPKLRDGFLRVLFDHANMGGFDGTFTQSRNLDTLRQALLDVAQKDFGTDISEVLILSLARQDS